MSELTPESPKISILSLATHRDPWWRMTAIQRQTWQKLARRTDVLHILGRQDLPDIQSLDWIYGILTAGRNDPVRHALGSALHICIDSGIVRLPQGRLSLKRADRLGDELQTHVGESLPYAGLRTRIAIETTLALEPDFVVRTNATSYLNIAALGTWLKDQPRRGFYAGLPCSHAGRKFANGAFVVMSKDVAQMIAEVPLSSWPVGLPDDVALGDILRRRKVALHPIPHINVYDEVALRSLDSGELRSAPHFRLGWRLGFEWWKRAMLKIHSQIEAQSASS